MLQMLQRVVLSYFQGGLNKFCGPPMGNLSDFNKNKQYQGRCQCSDWFLHDYILSTENLSAEIICLYFLDENYFLTVLCIPLCPDTVL